MRQGIVCKYTDENTDTEVFLEGLNWDADENLIRHVLEVYVFPSNDLLVIASHYETRGFDVYFFPEGYGYDIILETKDATLVGRLQFMSMGMGKYSGFIPEGGFTE
jgi:hypothetical protein